MRGPMREDQEAVYRNNSADSDHDNIRVVAPHSLVDCPDMRVAYAPLQAFCVDRRHKLVTTP